MKVELGSRLAKCYDVYLGDRPALWDDIHVLPAEEFLMKMWAGDVLD